MKNFVLFEHKINNGKIVLRQMIKVYRNELNKGELYKAMGKIKIYKSLNDEEKQRIYKFMSVETDYINSIEQINEIYNSKIYDYGNGVLFYFIENKVVASLCVVLEVAKTLKTAYIYKIVIDKEIENTSEILDELIQKGILIAKDYNVSNIKLGLDEKALKYLGRYGFEYEYRAIKMKLEDRMKKYETLCLRELSKLNKGRYVEIYNKSFSDMPHGTIVEIETINDIFINPKEEGKEIFHFIVYDNDEEIGFMEATIENNKGMFDIGLMKEYRGKGYGRRLLETAIQFLVDKKVDEILLIVIEANKVAYEMYKKRGFKESHVIGYWSNIFNEI